MKKEKLTPAEILLLKGLEKQNAKENDEEPESGAKRKFVSIDAEIEEFEKSQNEVVYDLKFINPTSNIVERLFSICKLIYTELRQSMDVDNFEALLILKANIHLWSKAMITEAICETAIM